MTILPNSKKRHKLPIQANRWNSSRRPKMELRAPTPCGSYMAKMTMYARCIDEIAKARRCSRTRRSRGALAVLVAFPAVAYAAVYAVLITARIVPGRSDI
ncbi:hypothetical protein [Paraburkholderia youngii]|uniref:hypothetical protein n=1 Tax=Paraburkholderia youngii TaxID=2782701 RepID=UPI001592C050|nr:hypothetical protein [Paraburkholderia youngii]